MWYTPSSQTSAVVVEVVEDADDVVVEVVVDVVGEIVDEDVVAKQVQRLDRTLGAVHVKKGENADGAVV